MAKAKKDKKGWYPGKYTGQANKPIKTSIKRVGETKSVVKGKVKTKGGTYDVYDSESKWAQSFRSAFGQARRRGLKSFKWKGVDGKTKSFSTRLKNGS